MTDQDWETMPVGTAKKMEQMREAMQEFVDRCDKGFIQSKYTYKKFKEILNGDS